MKECFLVAAGNRTLHEPLPESNRLRDIARCPSMTPPKSTRRMKKALESHPPVTAHKQGAVGGG